MATYRGIAPLTGVRVIDVATARGELAGRFLAELGAEVIKVEGPGGAQSRSMPPFSTADGTRSLFWETAGLGKRSVVLPMRPTPGDRSVLDLVGAADVFIESSNPGEMDAAGLGYEALRIANPRLIYVSITPFGQTGPRATDPATDLTIQAAGGIVSLQGDPDRRPVPIGEPHTAAYHAGAQAAADTVIALNERARSGLGQHLDVSMQAAIVWTLMNATGFPPNEGGDPPGHGDDRGQAPMTAGAAVLKRAGITVPVPGIWECSDGYLYALFLPTEQRADLFLSALRWAAETGALDDDRDLLDVTWNTYLADVESGRLDQEPLRRAVDCLKVMFRRVSKREVMERSIRDNLFCAPIYTTRDLLEDPQLAARGFWRTIEGVVHPGPFARLSATPLTNPRPAPTLGQDQSLAEAIHHSEVPPVGRLSTGALRPRPLEGLKVADFAWVGVGPIVAKALADHGATVVHVESRRRTDTLRMAAPFKGGVQDPDLSQFFANFNTSKLSLGVDLTTAGGHEIARKLIDWADVVVESFTPGTMAKLGLDYDTISRDRSDLVMFSTCLRGQTGPEAPLAGYGTAGAALSGLHSITGWPDRAPAGPWGAYTDFITPRLGVAALTAALYHRGKTGEGQHIDISQVECGINFLAPEILDYTVNGNVAQAFGDASPNAFPNGVYQVAGASRYLALSVENAAQWDALQQLAFPGRFAEKAFEDIDNRRRQGAVIEEELRRWLLPQEGALAVASLVRAGVPASTVSRPSDLYRDAQLSHRRFFAPFEHSRMGLTPYDGFVTKFSSIPSAPRTAAPCLGEHTGFVLTELLGLSPEDVTSYYETAVLR
ncbi:MAG: CaiB/BaiF CoA transferase family protein [Dehalococcoidia bacterium]